MFLTDRLNITSKREYTDEGFLKVPARIARSGIQEYFAGEMGLTDREPTEVVRVFRPDEEVFRDESLASFASKPVTNDHPPELVTAKNAKRFAVGHSGPDITKDGMFVAATLFVTDEETIKSIESGKVELSNGYTADIEYSPGVTKDGEQFDAVQKNIKGNHIAVVTKGRAGASCKVADKLTTIGDMQNMKFTIDGVDYEASEQVAQAVDKLQKRLTDAEKKAEDTEEEMKKKEDEEEEAKKEAAKTTDSLKAKLDDALSKVPSAETMDKLVEDRLNLIDTIKKITPELKWEGKDSDSLKKEVVALKCPKVQLDSVSVDYVNARFDMLAEAADENTQSSITDALKKQMQNNDSDKDTRPDSIIARDNFRKRNREAYKGGAK